MSGKGPGETTIVAFGAHAGDMEITAGGTILNYTLMGAKVLLAIVLRPSGVWARPPELTIEQYADLRYRQAFDVGKALGADVRFLNYKEGEPVNGEELKLRVCEILREFKPDIVLTHWKGSYHPDHIMTYLNVMGGIEKAGSREVWMTLPPHKVRAVFFPENWEDPQGFVRDFYVDISEVFEQYVRAISKYDFTSGRYSGSNYIDYYSSLFRVRGLEAGFRYAQAFMLHDEWGARRLKGKFLSI